ncbi:MAG: hypothetical protein E4H11_04885 [Myxococcales bacterium]|nr:MAG: hypothetical protein E4H11_04885 [Myxococcales bacterium]
MLRLSIDFECPAPIWWEKGGQELWDSITEAFDGSSVVVDDALAESWLARAREIQGWNGGPDYAPHPIALSTVADDDVFI